MIQMHSNSLHHDAKDELPDTGDSDSNSTGLVSLLQNSRIRDYLVNLKIKKIKE